jgi:hypothetical protein
VKASPDLYLVLRHRKDSQVWSNAWLDDDRIDAIETNREVAQRCEQALLSDKTIFVHRCAWAGGPPIISCSMKVASVNSISKKDWLVRFKDQSAILRSPTPGQPMAGQNLYDA